MATESQPWIASWPGPRGAVIVGGLASWPVGPEALAWPRLADHATYQLPHPPPYPIYSKSHKMGDARSTNVRSFTVKARHPILCLNAPHTLSLTVRTLVLLTVDVTVTAKVQPIHRTPDVRTSVVDAFDVPVTESRDHRAYFLSIVVWLMFVCEAICRRLTPELRSSTISLSRSVSASRIIELHSCNCMSFVV